MIETSGAAWWLSSNILGQAFIRLETSLHPDAAEPTALAIALVRQEASRLGMTSVIAQIGHIQSYLDRDRHSDAKLRQLIYDLAQRVKDELDGQLFVGIEARHRSFYRSDSPLFGQAVFDRFPSAGEDIAEAGKCLSLGRGTACVMHLMRAVEVALQALAGAVGVSPRNDWGSYLRDIARALEANARTAGARTPEEQFYAEAAAQFEHVRRAWRNPTMHVDRSYSIDRAEEIFAAVKSFMVLLAARIAEQV